MYAWAREVHPDDPWVTMCHTHIIESKICGGVAVHPLALKVSVRRRAYSHPIVIRYEFGRLTHWRPLYIIRLSRPRFFKKGCEYLVIMNIWTWPGNWLGYGSVDSQVQALGEVLRLKSAHHIAWHHVRYCGFAKTLAFQFLWSLHTIGVKIATSRRTTSPSQIGYLTSRVIHVALNMLVCIYLLLATLVHSKQPNAAPDVRRTSSVGTPKRTTDTHTPTTRINIKRANNQKRLNL